MILGLLYADRPFCRNVIVWKSKWKQDEGTLLHEILGDCKIAPPISLLELIVDIAPEVVRITDVAGFLPIQYAVIRYSSVETFQLPLEVVKIHCRS